MTKDELIHGLLEIVRRQLDRNVRAPETDHGAADRLLLDFIEDQRVTEVYDSITKWYS